MLFDDIFDIHGNVMLYSSETGRFIQLLFICMLVCLPACLFDCLFLSISACVFVCRYVSSCCLDWRINARVTLALPAAVGIECSAAGLHGSTDRERFATTSSQEIVASRRRRQELCVSVATTHVV